MIKAAQKYHRNITYYGFDLFEEVTESKIKEELSKTLPSISIVEVEAKLKKSGAKIHLFKGSTVKTLPQTVKRLPKMDFIFIDGGRSLEIIANDWKYASRLMHKQTFVIFDDYYEDKEDTGAKPIIDKIDRQSYNVCVLQPQDLFTKDWGELKINCVQVTYNNPNS